MLAPLNVLWTSGWDSTFRVADLVLNQKQQVQPWYVIDSVRRSTSKELQTIAQIRGALIDKDPTAAGRLHDLKIVNKSDIPPDTEISASYKRLATQGHLGTQYNWLARLAKAEGVRLELSIHCDDKAHGFLEGYTSADEHGVHYLTDLQPGPLKLFHWFSFPLFDLSKLDMQARAESNNFEDIMEMTWFCFVPLLDGRPCGFCNPCKYTREEGLGRRVPDATLWRKTQYITLFNLARANSLLHNRVIPGLRKR